MPVNTHFSTDFTGATNPALTPVPWSSVSEDASNDVLYGATSGLSGGPGMRVTFGGANPGGVGIYTLPADLVFSDGLIESTCYWKAPTLPFVGLAGSAHGLARLRAAAATLFTVQFYKLSALVPIFRLVYTPTALTVEGTTTIVANTFYKLALIVDGTPGSEAAQLYLDDVLEISMSGFGAITNLNNVRCGGINVSATPVVGTEYDYDDVLLTQTIADGGGSPGLGSFSTRRSALGRIGF